MQQFIKHVGQSKWLYGFGLILGLVQASVFDFSYPPDAAWLPAALNAIAIAGFLLFIRQLSPKRAAGFGYAFGLGLFGWGINWVYISMATFGGAPLAFAILANAAAVVVLSLYWLLAAYLIAKLGKTVNQRLLLAPAIIAALEWLRSVFFIGFPWLSLGYAWIDTKLSLLSQLGGVFFVTFTAILSIALLLLTVPKHLRAVSVLAACTLSIALPYQLSKATQPETTKSTTVSLVQGNMPVITEYNHQRMNQNLAQYHVLTESLLADNNPDVVIWPEAAIPYFYVEAGDFLGDIFALQQTHQFDLITGIPHANWDSNAIYNGVLLQQQLDQKPQFYNKSHLLPFGEYLPFRTVFAFFEDFVDIPMSDFARGKPVQPPFAAGGLNFSASICFEAVFGDEIRQSAKGSDILLNVSNDAWFGRSKAQIQHLNIARMRAIENQKMLVRATNDGRTAIVDRQGNILQTLPPFQEGTLTATVTANHAKTLYATFGDTLIVILCLALIAAIALFSRFKISREKV